MNKPWWKLVLVWLGVFIGSIAGLISLLVWGRLAVLVIGAGVLATIVTHTYKEHKNDYKPR